MKSLIRIFQAVAWAVLIVSIGWIGVQPVQALLGVTENWSFTAENPTPVTGPLDKAWACSETEFYFSGYLSNVLFRYNNGVVTRSYSTASRILGINGTGCSDVTIVTKDGKIYHYDGTSWSILSNTYIDLMKAWVGSSTAVFATSVSGINFYNGVEWTVMTGTSGWLVYEIWGLDPANVYAVGENGTVAYYNGSSWSTTTVSPGASFGAVWARSTSDVYVSGSGGSVWHYNGTNWHLIRSGVVNDATFAIGGTASTVVIAGWTGPDSLVEPMLEQYNGSSWTKAAAAYVSSLYRVVTASGSHVYVVGEVGAILHYDGVSWEEISQRVAVTAITGAWGSGPNDIFAVGKMNYYQTYNSKINTILHYNGIAWSNIALTKTFVNYTGVWGSAPDNVYAIGNPLYSDNAAVYHYNGVQWSPVTTTTVKSQAYAIWGSGPDDIFVLGRNASQSNGIHHFDGVSWSEMTTPGLPPLYALWGSGPNDVFAVGYYGVIVHYDGSEWKEMTGTGSITQLNSVWGSGPNDVYAVGNNGLVLHYNGTNWSLLPPLGSGNLISIWGYSSTDIFVSTKFSDFYHYNGSTWSKVQSPVSNITAMWGSNPGQIRLFGANGQIVNAFVTRNIFVPLLQR